MIGSDGNWRIVPGEPPAFERFNGWVDAAQHERLLAEVEELRRRVAVLESNVHRGIGVR